MSDIIGRNQRAIGYFAAVLLAAGAMAPLASSSFFGTTNFMQDGKGDGFFLSCAGLASVLLVYFRKFVWLWLTAITAGVICLLALCTIAFETEAGAGQLAALSLGSAFVDFGNSYWGSLRIGSGVPVVLMGVGGLLAAAWPSTSKAKIYDILIALPLIAFYVHGARNEFSIIIYRVSQLITGTASLTGTLQGIALLASTLFSMLLILLIFARSVPVGKAHTLMPRVAAILGTFAGTAFLYLEPIALPLGLQVLATLMTTVGMIFSFLVLMKLGRSFSIMPEARKLVTTGPYAVVRHPLYMVEEIAVFGMLIQFAGPFALGFALAHITLQYIRSVYEEQVLTATFPDYAAYRLRTRWRFVPGLI